MTMMIVPILVTLLGIVTDVSDVHPARAFGASDVYWAGTVKVVPVGHENQAP